MDDIHMYVAFTLIVAANYNWKKNPFYFKPVSEYKVLNLFFSSAFTVIFITVLNKNVTEKTVLKKQLGREGHSPTPSHLTFLFMHTSLTI